MGNFKMDHKEIECESVELTHARTLADSCDHNIEPLDSIKCKECLC
jgi:hypothetical protein